LLDTLFLFPFRGAEDNEMDAMIQCRKSVRENIVWWNGKFDTKVMAVLRRRNKPKIDR